MPWWSVHVSSLWPSPCPAGETTTTVAPQVPGGVSDGRWHWVQVRYYNKVGRLLQAAPAGALRLFGLKTHKR